MSKNVVAMYEDFATARAVVEDLVNAGFSRENISIVAADTSGDFARYATSGSGDDDVSSGEGAGFGAVVGALVGLGVALIPGVGPVLAAGPVAAALMAGIGAATGAVTGGVVAGLVDMGVPEEDARYYEEGIRGGRSLVTVTAEDASAARAQDIMNRHGAIDVHADYGSMASSSQPSTTQTTNYSSSTAVPQEQARFDIVEEEVQVGKREVEGGGVRVRSYVTETPVQEQVRLREEHVVVERHPVNRPASEADIAAFQEGVIEVTEHHEEAVVAKQARVVEEVVVGKDVTEHVETIHETVRRTDVEVENLGSTGSTYGTYETFEPRFRNLHSTRYGGAGMTYESYLPAYRYAHTLASDPRYSGYDWNRLESEARRSWEERNPNTWEQFKDAVRDAWTEVTGRR